MNDMNEQLCEDSRLLMLLSLGASCESNRETMQACEIQHEQRDLPLPVKHSLLRARMARN